MAYASGSDRAAIEDGSTCRNLILEFADIPEPFQIFLRIRSLTATECFNGAQLMSYSANEKKLTIIPKTGGVGQVFTFSRILNIDQNQAAVFDATSLCALQEFISGQNCIIFSYGVTNSGKTFTMQGPPSDPGIIPRALDVIFESVCNRISAGPLLLKPQNGGVARLTRKDLTIEEKMKQQVLKDANSTCSLLMESLNASQWKNSTASSSTDVSRQSLASVRSMIDHMDEDVVYGIFVSFVEIYNEKVYDLLMPVANSAHQLFRPDLKIQENRNGHVFIKGVREMQVHSVDEALQLLLLGQQNLQVASTRMNYSSSRSHSMYIVKLLRVINGDTPNAAHVSQLCFCDLAGSERHAKTESVGPRFKEAGIINSSLLVLGRCISALRHNQLYPNEAPLPIPFRESKLTRVFQGYFTGLGKALMIVSVSPDARSVNETMHVLRFSAIAKEVLLPQNLEFLSNPVKVSNLSLDLIRQSLDGAQSILWASPRASSASGVGRLESYARQPSDVLLEEDENDAADNEESQCDEEKSLLQKYIEVVPILRDMVIKEHKEKNEIEFKVRNELSSTFAKILDDEQKRTSQRIQAEREDAEKMFNRRLEIQAEYYAKQIAYKQKEIDCAKSGQDLDTLKFNVESLKAALNDVNDENRNFEQKLKEQNELQEKVLLENLSKIASLEEEVKTLQSQLLQKASRQSCARRETFYETVVVTSSAASESDDAPRAAHRRSSQMYVTMVDPPTTDLESSGASTSDDAVYHDVYSAKRPTRRPSLFAADTSYESNLSVQCISKSCSDEKGEIKISETMEMVNVDEVAQPATEFICVEQQTELNVADISALETRKCNLEETIVNLEATVGKLHGTRQCLELDESEKRKEIAELTAQVEALRSEAGALNERLQLEAIREEKVAGIHEAAIADLHEKLLVAEKAKENYALDLEDARKVCKNLADEVESLRVDLKDLQKQSSDELIETALKCKEYKAERESLKMTVTTERSAYSALLEKYEELNEKFKAESLKSKFLETELQKPKTRGMLPVANTDDSDFENEPIQTRRRTTRQNTRTKKKVTVVQVYDTSDDSILPNVPSTTKKTISKNKTRTLSRTRAKSMMFTLDETDEEKSRGVKSTCKKRLVKRMDIPEFSPTFSPEKKPDTKELVQRVLRSRK